MDRRWCANHPRHVRGESGHRDGRREASLGIMRWQDRELELRLTLDMVPTVVLAAAFVVVLQALATIHPTVPPVLHGVVTSTGQSSSDLGPSLPNLGHLSLDILPFGLSDRGMVQRFLQVLVVPFPALLRRSSSHRVRDDYPARGAVVFDEVHELLVLELAPWSSLVVRMSRHVWQSDPE